MEFSADIWSSCLITWQGAVGYRTFAWRETRNPWNVLVAEILLQKTSARQVQGVYQSLMESYGSPEEMAQAEASLEERLAPLGLQSRAAKLRGIAAAIVAQHGGLVPTDVADLLALPGVGPYTARAVLCFSFDQRVPIVDSNVIRVFGRAIGVTTLKRNNKERDPMYWRLAEDLLPSSDQVRRYNYALLDLGARYALQESPGAAGVQ